jgi:hypothetical protein
MIYIEIMGGLGNQLFQIFCGIAYSLENRIPFKINGTKFDIVSPLDNISKRPTYWNNFLKNLSNFTYKQHLQIPYSYFETEYFKFDKIPYIKQDFKLHGYYQSYKYFDGQFANICKMINLANQKLEIYEKHKVLLGGVKKPISIHFRIGDYVKNQAMHPILNSEYYINSINYLKSNLDNFEENYYLLIFGENSDNEKILFNIEKIKRTSNIEIVTCDYEIPDYEQLLLMSLCSHNIIANSTFSWWGAYFNNNFNKIVCYPNIWNGSTNNIDDLFPEDWIKILS